MFWDSRPLYVLCVTLSVCQARGWSWPEGAESVRIDTKVRFLDEAPRQHTQDNSKKEPQLDEVPFREPSDTEGFYNRPSGAGRYPVRVENSKAAYQVDNRGVYPVSQGNDGTLDSLQFCKCVTNPDCNPRPNSHESCGVGRYLCCYKRPTKAHQSNTEFFNEIDDERPMLFPGIENIGGPFPPPPGSELNGAFGPGHGHETALLGAVDDRRELHGDRRPVLVGPGGPTGQIGPNGLSPHNLEQQKQVLVGPEGPTGVIGPAPVANHNIDSSESAQRGVLVGPGGPTGIIGPYNQRPVLVGPRGPTGVIGPNRGGSRGVLVGPGGPTGVIGPGFGRQQGSGFGRQQGPGFGRQQGPGLLVGPGGPTGIIGPGRQLLVGPGGPTGHIGPQRYFVKRVSKEKTNETATAKAIPEQSTGEILITTSKFPRNPETTFSETNTSNVTSASRIHRSNCNRGKCRPARALNIPQPSRGCSRPDNSCGGNKRDGKKSPKNSQIRRGFRRRGDPKDKTMKKVLEERGRAENTHPFRKEHLREKATMKEATSTVKPSIFRYVPNYVLLLQAIQVMLSLGIF